MSASVESQIEELPTSKFQLAEDAQSEFGDGSSSLSDIEDKDPDQDDQDDFDDLDDQDDLLSVNEEESDANDSEAETERLENSPHLQRNSKEVVLSSQAESRTYERSPSKLQRQFNDEEEDEDDEDDEDNEDNEDDENDADNLSDEEGSIAESAKSIGLEGVERDPTTATTSLEDSSGEGKGSMVGLDAVSKKRKRSLLPEGGLSGNVDLDEPARKRTGSIGAHGDDHAVDDTASANGEAETSNPISGDISDVESNDPQEDNDDDRRDDVQEDAGAEEDAEEDIITVDTRPKSERKKNWRNRGDAELQDVEHSDANGGQTSNNIIHEAGDGEEHDETIDADGDEAEMALKNEEEQEKKRLAMEQLGDIERHFTAFRDRLYDERLARLEQEEAMLRQDKPTHPDYLAMLQCIDARRTEKIRIQERLLELKLETLKRSAVGKRSQILSQYYQEVRDIRESKLDSLGKQWYDIYHDRRGHGSNVEDYVLKFPTRKSQLLKNQVDYNTEVSITSGVAKYVGFPAAPKMATATVAQIEEDAEKINLLKLKNQRLQAEMPLQNMVSIRAAAASTFKPAEERFIEQTPWANPQHPSHAHLIQRQPSAHPTARTSSPFSIPSGIQQRRHSHHHAIVAPVVGTFPSTVAAVQSQTNGGFISSGRISPVNPLTIHSQKVAPSPFSIRQESPRDSKQVAVSQLQQSEQPRDFLPGPSNAPFPTVRTGLDLNSSFPQDLGQAASVKREQISATNGRF